MNNPIALGNIGDSIYLFQILSPVENIENLALAKMSMSAWYRHFKKLVRFESVGMYFIFPNEVFFLILSNTNHFMIVDERDFFETLIDNRIEHRGDPSGMLSSLKQLTRYLQFHKSVSSTNSMKYQDIDQFFC